MKAKIPRAITAKGIPIPIPIFAPLVRPFGLAGRVEEGVEDVVVGEEEVSEVVVGVDFPVAAANDARSELCHHTGIPSPETSKVGFAVATYVLAKFPSV
jgi:hypothetical protein